MGGLCSCQLEIGACLVSFVFLSAVGNSSQCCVVVVALVRDDVRFLVELLQVLFLERGKVLCMSFLLGIVIVLEDDLTDGGSELGLLVRSTLSWDVAVSDESLLLRDEILINSRFKIQVVHVSWLLYNFRFSRRLEHFLLQKETRFSLVLFRVKFFEKLLSELLVANCVTVLVFREHFLNLLISWHIVFGKDLFEVG